MSEKIVKTNVKLNWPTAKRNTALSAKFPKRTDVFQQQRIPFSAASSWYTTTLPMTTLSTIARRSAKLWFDSTSPKCNQQPRLLKAQACSMPADLTVTKTPHFVFVCSSSLRKADGAPALSEIYNICYIKRLPTPSAYYINSLLNRNGGSLLVGRCFVIINKEKGEKGKKSMFWRKYNLF